MASGSRSWQNQGPSLVVRVKYANFLTCASMVRIRQVRPQNRKRKIVCFDKRLIYWHAVFYSSRMRNTSFQIETFAP